MRIARLLTVVGLIGFQFSMFACKPRHYNQAVSGSALDIDVVGEIRKSASGQNEVWARVNNQAWTRVGAVVALSRPSKLYLWTTPEYSSEIIQKTKIDSGFVDSFVEKDTQPAGGGLYVGLNPYASHHTGVEPIAFELSQEFQLLDASTFNTGFGRLTDLSVRVALRKAGVIGITRFSNSDSSINIVHSSPFARARTLNPTDFSNLEGFGTNAMALSQAILQVDQKVSFAQNTFSQVAPVQKLLSGVAGSDKSNLLKAYRTVCLGPNGDRSLPADQVTRQLPVSQVKGTFGKPPLLVAHTELWRTLSTALRKDVIAEVQVSAQAKNKSQTTALRLLDCLNEDAATYYPTIEAGLRRFRWTDARTLRAFEQPSPMEDKFLTNFMWAFEFIDLNDLLLEMAQGRTEPWRRYDSQDNKTSSLERWQKAIQTPGGGSQPPKLLDIYATISESKDNPFRTRRVIAGGALDTKGQLINGPTWNGEGLFRATEPQIAALKANPYLTVEVVSTNKTLSGRTTQLARYEYPSASTYKRFSSLLSSTLVSRLQAAESLGALKDPNNASFKSLTQEIVKELVARAMTLHAKEPELLYYNLMSIHPFSDFNGRSLRALYRIHAGEPLFLPNWDLDIVLSPEAFEDRVIVGKRQWMWMVSAMKQEFVNNRQATKKYYDLAHPWLIAAGKQPGDETPEFVSRFKSWIQTPDTKVFIEKKLYLDFLDSLSKAIPSR